MKINQKKWKKNNMLPPKKLLTDDNITRFFAFVWTSGHQPSSMKSAKSFISWCLKENHKKSFIKEHNYVYVKSWNYWKNLKKDPRWRDYVPDAATSLTQEEVKKIANAPIRDRHGNINKAWLRDKVAAFALIHCGWHPIDCHRTNWKNCKEVLGGIDPSRGLCQPCIKINMRATKRPGQRARNYFVCGCHNKHDLDNDSCEYGLVKKLIEDLGEEKANESLFWTTKDKGKNWGQQGKQKKGKISESLERINKRVRVRLGKLTGDMGRKTFVTLGKNFFLFPEDHLKEITHHQSNDNFIKYIDPQYINIGSETVMSRIFQAYEQGRYLPPTTNALPHMIVNLGERIDRLSQMFLLRAQGADVKTITEFANKNTCTE